MPITLGPPVSGIRAVTLGRYPESGSPYVLTLEFEAGAEPTVAELAAAFGAYERGSSDRGQPIPLHFERQFQGSNWKVALIAEIPPGASGPDRAKVQRVSLRRDPVHAPGRRDSHEAGP